MSIYQESPSSVFPLLVTQALNEQLGFTCQTVLVDNYTDQYLYFPDIARYVPPSTFGAVLPYRPMNNLRATFTFPPGITPVVIQPGQSASVTALAAQVPPSPGVSTNDTFNIAQGTVTAVIASGVIDANITNATLDANITNATLDAKITSGTLDANITNATIDTRITNGTLNANITNATLNAQTLDITPLIVMHQAQMLFPAPAATWQRLFQLPVPSQVHGWQISSANAPGMVAIALWSINFPPTFGVVNDPRYDTILHASYAPAYGVSSIILPPGLAIPITSSNLGVWVYTDQSGLDASITIYYST